MAYFTTLVETIVQALNEETERPSYSDINTRIIAVLDDIFEDFPIFDEDYREELCLKIIRHFYTREIGYETFALWKLHLNNRMFEIMPYYNQLYKSALMQIDPLSDVDLTTNSNRDQKYESNGVQNEMRGSKQASSGESTDSQVSGTKGVHKFQDTPQGATDGFIEDGYTTNITIDDNTGNSVNKGEHNTSIDTTGHTINNDARFTNTNEGYLERVVGRKGFKTASVMLNEFRTTFLNIDMQIIADLESLFMGLWE